MGTYILKRVLAVIPVLVIISFLTVALLRLVPGDAAATLAGETATPQQIVAIRHDLRLDRPIPVQYALFMRDLLHGNLGRSLKTNRLVTDELRARFPYTAQLALAAMFISVILGVTIGIISATRQNTILDNIVMVGVITGYSIPSFWAGLLLILLFGVKLHILPFLGDESPKNLILPAVTLGLQPAAVFARLTRASMIEVIHLDYVRTAWAKGLRERTVIVRHALKNALIPVVTVIGLEVGGLLGGAVITETIFNWPGIGTMAVTAINSHDYPIVQGVVLLATFIFVAINLIVDLLYGFLDPRIRYE
ncbi:MAG: ABC transporter permease [Chloroflexota bacterium]|nr:ABC transporter permease [Chloroflexota bacterium]